MASYKYGFMVKTLQIRAEMADMNADQISEQFAIGLGHEAEELSNSMENIPGGPAEIVSHNIARIGQNLILSVLIRQPQ